MKISIDTEKRTLETETETLALYSTQAFEILSSLWLKVGWDQRHHYNFNWLGRPIFQLPEDLIRLQEKIWEIRPTVVIETGIAYGGSLLFYATLCQLMGTGKVVGIDIDLHKPNREALLQHALAPWLVLIEGDSVDVTAFAKVKEEIGPEDSVFVVLDSNHSKAHVLQELHLYAPLVTANSYIVVADGFKKNLSDVPRGKSHWAWDNPFDAVQEFLAKTEGFILESPKRRDQKDDVVTHFAGAWLKRRSS